MTEQEKSKIRQAFAIHKGVEIYFVPAAATGGFLNNGHDRYYWHPHLPYKPFYSLDEAKRSIEECLGYHTPGCSNYGGNQMTE